MALQPGGNQIPKPMEPHGIPMLAMKFGIKWQGAFYLPIHVLESYQILSNLINLSWNLGQHETGSRQVIYHDLSIPNNAISDSVACLHTSALMMKGDKGRKK